MSENYIFQKSPLFILAAVLFAVTNVTPQYTLDRVDSPDVLILDVRENSEYEAGHIPGAWLMPWNSGVLAERWQELPTDRLIIVHCASGGRSVGAANFLDGKGIFDVVNMSGGFSSYRNLPGALIETGPYVEPETPVVGWLLY